VCGIAGVPLCFCFLPSLVAVVLGVIAMSETRRTGQSGYKLAMAGLTVGVVTLVIGLFLALASA
jgi:Na+/H+-dicarboxylate symporter